MIKTIIKLNIHKVNITVMRNADNSRKNLYNKKAHIYGEPLIYNICSDEK